MEDTFADYDGAYVLGALSDAERDAFEEHLLTCVDCQARVAEVADLPALLALAPASAFAPPSVAVADPVVVLLETVRARRRRRRVFTATIAGLAAACLVLVTALLTHRDTNKPTAVAPAAARPVAMSPLINAPIHATAAVTNLLWGTSIVLTCTYDEAGNYPPVEYTLEVQSRSGSMDTLGTWNVVPGKVTTFRAGTAIHAADIKSITVATTSGTSVLELTY